MTEFRKVANEGEIILNNIPLKVDGTIGYDLVNSYGRKIQQGDPNADDHPLNSVITQANWTGGIGVKKYRGDDSRGNSYWSTMWTGTENLLALPPKTLVLPASIYAAGTSNDMVWPHDKIGSTFYATYGAKIRRWNETTDAMEAFGSTDASGIPVGPGITFGDATTSKRLWIPLGSGYATHDGVTNFTAGVGGEGAISFVVWQQKLFKLDSAGVIKVWTSPTWTEKGRLTSDLVPRSLFLHYDNDNKTAVHVSTSGGVYILDYLNAILWETPLIFPDHPFQGHAATLWRADAYVSVGAGVHRDAKGIVTAVGPDGKDGLPPDYSYGYFTSFAPGYNGMLGLYRAFDPSFVSSPETTDMGISPPEGMYTQDPKSFGILMEFNTLGWHPKWVGRDTPTGVRIVSTFGIYRAFWGGIGNLYTQILPTGYYNPSYNQNQTPLERYARHETPYFNFGIDDNPKITKQIEVKSINCSTKNYLVAWVRIDDQVGWGNGVTEGTPFATITTNGEHHLDIGFELVGDQLRHHGQTIERIQLAFEAYGDPANEYATPGIEWYSIVGRKWMRATRTFTAAINLEGPYDGRDPLTMFNVIFNSAVSKTGSTVVIRDQAYDVDVTQNNGNFKSGLKFDSIINIAMAEITEVDA